MVFAMCLGIVNVPVYAQESETVEAVYETEKTNNRYAVKNAGWNQDIALGANFPVVDRLIMDERIIVSTKSLDISAQGYQSTTKLNNVLNKYADSLKWLEEKLFYNDDIFVWGKRR